MDLLLLAICLAAGFLIGLFVTSYIVRSMVLTIPMTRALDAQGIHRHASKAYVRTAVRILAMTAAIFLCGIAIYQSPEQEFYLMVFIVAQLLAVYITRKPGYGSSGLPTKGIHL